MARVVSVTFALLGLHTLHHLEPLEHPPEVRDAVLEGDFLVVARFGLLQDFPHVHLFSFRLSVFLLPEFQGTKVTEITFLARAAK